MKTMEVLRLSKEMMDGQKWNAFVLGLSFLGWQLLGTLLCGIGTFFVQPYVDATFAELTQCFADHIPDVSMDSAGNRLYRIMRVTVVSMWSRTV